MVFYLNNETGSGYRYPTKEAFLKHLSMAIDQHMADGATYFDVSFESDARYDRDATKGETD